MKPDGLTKRESQIMTVLWKSDKPLSASEILAISPELSKNTIQIVLKKLQTLGCIEVAGFTYNKNALTRTFKPIIEQSDFVIETLSDQTSLNVTKDFINKCEEADVLNELKDIIEKRLDTLAE